MSGYTFARATKHLARARVALIGPSGSGKTYTALAIATALGGKIAVIDTEHGSASKYASLFAFDVLELDTFSPLTYVEAMKAAAGYGVLVIDSLSHAWMGKDGALEQVDRLAKSSNSGNSYTAWRDVTPRHNALVEALVAHPTHLIVTMRSKTEYVLENDEKTGKMKPRKVGTAPIQRDGLEYEFDVVADLDLDHNLVVSKSRCPELDGVVINRAGAEIAGTLLAWLSDGAPASVPADAPTATSAPATGPQPLPADLLPDPPPEAPPGHPGPSGEDSWAATIDACDDPTRLLGYLVAIDAEPDVFRRAGALRLWRGRLVDIGSPADLTTAGKAIRQWPADTASRTEMLDSLRAALADLKARVEVAP